MTKYFANFKFVGKKVGIQREAAPYNMKIVYLSTKS